MILSRRASSQLFAATALATLLLSGCSSFTSSSTSADGATVPAGLSQFTDVPIPAGASFDQSQSLILGSQLEWLGRLVLNTSNTARSLVEFYQNEMKRFGWTEVTVVRGDPSVLTFERGNRVATVQISERMLRGAQVTITMSPRGQPSGAGGGIAPAPSQGGSMAAPPSGPIQMTPLR
ncbi:MAG TPA: hypothetical protein VIM38_08730 [Alphaproteobacteria bacterium]